MENDVYENDDIIVLKSADGEEIEFLEIAGIALESGFYALLQPIELLDGMADDEALVFRCEHLDNDEIKYTIVLEDDIIDAAFKEYNRLLDELEEDK